MAKVDKSMHGVVIEYPIYYFVFFLNEDKTTKKDCCLHCSILYYDDTISSEVVKLCIFIATKLNDGCVPNASQS